MKLQYKVLFSTLILSLMISSALALPTGPRTLNVTTVGTLPTVDSVRVSALAGNVTGLSINSWSVTRTWQGYYGNVSGTLVLADQYNYTLYDWSNSDPNGRVYASRTATVPTWSTIRCLNETELDTFETVFSGSNITDRYGYMPIDRPNATFTKSFLEYDTMGDNNINGMWANYSTFYVGPSQINGTFNSSNEHETTQCYSAVMHNSNPLDQSNQNAGNDPNHWREVLLTDGDSSDSTLYTAILEQDDDDAGFDGNIHDFEMIVPENGQGTDISITNYYFYVELE